MKFLADMGISLRTVAWLRNQGHDASHLREEGLQRAPDPEILAKARAEGRILLTLDLDFGYLLAASRAQMPSVILFRLGNEASELVTRRLESALAQFGDSLQTGVMVSVTEDAIRLRRLPIV